MTEASTHVVTELEAGLRLDRLLCELRPGTSRDHARSLVAQGCVRVDGAETVRGSRRLDAGVRLEIEWRSHGELRGRDEASPESLNVLHEDEHLVVLDKAAGLVVHPGGSYRSGTLSQLAEERFGPLSRLGDEGQAHAGVERPGIVHRLDRETSGVIVLAKTDTAHRELQRQFREREVEKAYFAIVHGVTRFLSEWIHDEIARDERHPERMRIVREEGREASTYYQTVERFDGFTHLDCHPKTGRTHQIRVHLAARRFPIVRDALYPLRQRNALIVPKEAPPLARHALHARALTFTHPASGERVTYEADLPEDLETFVAWLRAARSSTRKRRGR